MIQYLFTKINTLHFLLRRLKNSLFIKKNKNRVLFNLGYQFQCGQTKAFLNLAHHLLDEYDVYFYAPKNSLILDQLHPDVIVINFHYKAGFLAVITDITGFELSRYKNVEKNVILSIHSLLQSGHNIPQTVIESAIDNASYIHFVSNIQKLNFTENLNLPKLHTHSFIIGNYISENTANGLTNTNNVGIVGHLERPLKNGIQAIEIAQSSLANQIHIWGAKQTHNSENITINKDKVIFHGWSNNENQLYQSFDVLISTSKSETFGLVVMEALSRGKPCLLSPIPAHIELFKNFPGVLFTSENLNENIEKLNTLIQNKMQLSHKIITYYQQHHANNVITLNWKKKIHYITQACRNEL
ncbi:glycosyltransferase [Thalassotalea agariperforans]